MVHSYGNIQLNSNINGNMIYEFHTYLFCYACKRITFYLFIYIMLIDIYACILVLKRISTDALLCLVESLLVI